MPYAICSTCLERFAWNNRRGADLRRLTCPVCKTATLRQAYWTPAGYVTTPPRRRALRKRKLVSTSMPLGPLVPAAPFAVTDQAAATPAESRSVPPARPAADGGWTAEEMWEFLTDLGGEG